MADCLLADIAHHILSEIIQNSELFLKSAGAIDAWASRDNATGTAGYQTPILVGVLSVLVLCLTAVAARFLKPLVRRLNRVLDAKHRHHVPAAQNGYKPSPYGPVYLVPADQHQGGQLQLQHLANVSPDSWEVDPRHVALGVEVGQGAFGRVLTGFYANQQVAIKVLKDELQTDLYRDDLLREIALMKGIGPHPNIVAMVGACTARRPVALVMEYVPYGNLLTFLKKCRGERECQQRVPDRDNITYCLIDELTGCKEQWTIHARDVLSFARQVALAMEYLSGRNLVHRDLAARNVLLGSNKVVKVCDFGLARVVCTGDQYCKLTSGRLPLKWMAIESIRDRVFTVDSDVWSFGVLLWEIVTMGASPYPSIALADVYRLLCEGYRMQQPKNCSDELPELIARSLVKHYECRWCIKRTSCRRVCGNLNAGTRYDIMSQCWCEAPTDRPSFELVRRQLEALLSQDVTYLELDDIDTPVAPQSQSTADNEDMDSDDDAEDDLRGSCTSSTLLGLHLDVC